MSKRSTNSSELTPNRKKPNSNHTKTPKNVAQSQPSSELSHQRSNKKPHRSSGRGSPQHNKARPNRARGTRTSYVNKPNAELDASAAVFVPGGKLQSTPTRMNNRRPMQAGNSRDNRRKNWKGRGPLNNDHSTYPGRNRRYNDRREIADATPIDGSLNHLLNFNYSRPVQPRQTRNRPQKASKYVQRFSKENFVQATYHFALEPGGHDKSLADPDHMVDWEAIQMMYYPCDAHYQCPICLDVPVAAKMTKCGHVFCYPCILHYLESSERSRRCPLCFETLYKRDIKSVLIQLRHKRVVGDTVKFILLKRYKDSVVPFEPEDQTTGRALMTGQSCSTIPGGVSEFARIIVTEDISDILRREREELINALDRCDEIYTAPYIHMALEEIEKRATSWLGKIHVQDRPLFQDSSLQKHSPPKLVPRVPKKTRSNVKSAFYNDDEDGTEFESGVTEIPIAGSGESKVSASEQNKQTDSEETDLAYYFYQAADGQQIYLHSLNWRCVAHQYVDPMNFPREIEADILEIAEHTQTEETRRRMRFLKHLPLTSSFKVCEVDLTHVLSEETIRHHAKELNKKKRDREKIRKQKIHEAKLQKLKEDEARRNIAFNRQSFPGLYRAEPDDNPFGFSSANSDAFWGDVQDSVPQSTELPPLPSSSPPNSAESPQVAPVSGSETTPPLPAEKSGPAWSRMVGRGHATAVVNLYPPLPSSGVASSDENKISHARAHSQPTLASHHGQAKVPQVHQNTNTPQWPVTADRGWIPKQEAKREKEEKPKAAHALPTGWKVLSTKKKGKKAILFSNSSGRTR